MPRLIKKAPITSTESPTNNSMPLGGSERFGFGSDRPDGCLRPDETLTIWTHEEASKMPNVQIVQIVQMNT